MHRSTIPTGVLSPAGILLLSACANVPGAVAPPELPPAEPAAVGAVITKEEVELVLVPETQDTEDLLLRVHDLLDQDEVEAAWRTLGSLLLAGHLDRATELVSAGKHLEALEEFDEALALDPRHLDALLDRGETCLAIGTAGNDPFFLEDGRANLMKAARLHDDPRAWLAASRASRMTFDYTQDPKRRGALALDALEQARRAVALLKGTEPGPDTPVDLLPQRVRAEAAFRAWLAAREGLLEISQQDLFGEVEDNLMATLAARPDDPWPYLELANLYQWEERMEDTLHALLRGLAIRPDDATLLQRLGDVGRDLGGRESLIEIYGTLSAENPDQAVILRLMGLEIFWSGLDALEATKGGAELFRRAEVAFRRCREVDVAFEEESIGWEITCRSGLGYALYHAGDLEGARQAFLSMESLKEGGLNWRLGERLPSGLMGLSFIVDRLAQDVNVSTMEVDNLESLGKAAAISDFLHAYDPEHPEWANNAGFFNRDFAFALETSAQAQIHAATRLDDAAASAAAREKGLARLTRARELMERSYAAYVNAARLSNEDVRIVNDTGLILTYYLQRDLETAEGYLMRAVALGREQLEAREDGVELDEDELYNLLNAWGDAHQNLGVLHLTLRKDPITARGWFEKAVDIGPDPREAITMPRGYLAQCSTAEVGTSEPVTPLRWGIAPTESSK